MARLFSIDFNFRQHRYSALVTACCSHGDTFSYTVAPNDEHLKTLLPGGKLMFNSLSDLQPLAERQPKLQELISCIASALNQKLEPASG